MEPYKPQPIDTSEIQLPTALLPLIEELARNVHDVWAKSRIDQGWTYGPERDDTNKRHPGLIDYDELPEREKAFDRATATETIKFILSRGFRIEGDYDN